MLPVLGRWQSCLFLWCGPVCEWHPVTLGEFVGLCCYHLSRYQILLSYRCRVIDIEKASGFNSLNSWKCVDCKSIQKKTQWLHVPMCVTVSSIADSSASVCSECISLWRTGIPKLLFTQNFLML